MIYLQATQIVRNSLGIGKEPLNEAGETTSLLGNWAVNIVPIGERQAFLFMSSRSMLSFPIMIGAKKPSLQDMPAFLAHGIKQTALEIGASKDKVARLLSDLDEIAICKAADKSLLANLRTVAADYSHHARGRGAKADMSRIVASVNSLPRKLFEYESSFEVSRELLGASDA